MYRWIQYTEKSSTLCRHTMLCSNITYSNVLHWGNRIIGNQRKIDVSEGTTYLQAKIRIRKNIITLSFIVVVTVCSILPRTIFGLYLQLSFEPCNSWLDVISATNNLLFLNPLCDPFIYIFRFKQYRDYLKCKCITYNHVTDTHIVWVNGLF